MALDWSRFNNFTIQIIEWATGQRLKPIGHTFNNFKAVHANVTSGFESQKYPRKTITRNGLAVVFSKRQKRVRMIRPWIYLRNFSAKHLVLYINHCKNTANYSPNNKNLKHSILHPTGRRMVLMYSRMRYLRCPKQKELILYSYPIAGDRFIECRHARNLLDFVGFGCRQIREASSVGSQKC